MVSGKKSPTPSLHYSGAFAGGHSRLSPPPNPLLFGRPHAGSPENFSVEIDSGSLLTCSIDMYDAIS
jgi:hypothetical protein